MAALLLSLVWVAAQMWGPAPPPSHRIAGVPLVEPNADLCGPAALAAVLQYHGDRTTMLEIAEQIHLPDLRGSINLDLLLFARSRGYRVWAGEGSAHLLRTAVARDRPALCLVRRGGPLASRNHIVVVRGYDGERGRWFVDGGGGAEEAVREAEFEREWARGGRWMLVVEGLLETADAGGEAEPCAP